MAVRRTTKEDILNKIAYYKNKLKMSKIEYSLWEQESEAGRIISYESIISDLEEELAEMENPTSKYIFIL